MSKSGESIIKGTRQALDFVKGDITKGRARIIIDSEIDVKAVRKVTGLSQVTFANIFGFSLSNIKKWETGIRQPTGPAKAYLTVIKQHPEIVKKALSKEY